MFGGIGMTELMVVFVVGLVVLGPKRLPSLARSLGRTLAEFRHASSDLRRDFMDVSNSISNETQSPAAIEATEEDAASESGSAAPKEPLATAPEAPTAKRPGGDAGSEPTGE